MHGQIAGGMGSTGRARELLWKVGVPLAALLGSATATLCVILVGLTTSMVIVWPLALGIGAAFAGLAATWISNFTSLDGTRARLPFVLLTSEAGAVLAILLAFVFTASTSLTFLAAPVAVLVVAATACVGTWYFRVEGSRLGQGGLAAFVLSVVAAIILFAVSPGGSWILEGAGILPSHSLLASSAGLFLSLFSSLALVVLGVWIATRSSRRPGLELGRDAGVTLAVIGVIAPIFQGTLYVACLAGACGAV